MADNKTYSVLFVCLGNICRSPAAEGIFKEMVAKEGLQDRIAVDSAGTSGYHEGELPDARMRVHGSKRGYNFRSHSRKFRSSDFDKFNVIITMDDNNYRKVLSLSQSIDDDKKVYRMTDFLTRHDADHVPDPYYSGDDGFEKVLNLLEDACEGLLQKLKDDEL